MRECRKCLQIASGRAGGVDPSEVSFVAFGQRLAKSFGAVAWALLCAAMSMRILCLLLASVVTVSAAKIEYSAVAQNANLTSHDWVFGSKMWGTIESGTSTATLIEGFSSLAGLDPAQFTWTFGDLELSSYLVPTATTAGFEVYSETDASVTPLNFYYGGSLLATGTLFDITVHVAHNMDGTAAGTGTGQITGAGINSAFYDEIMVLTGGSGRLSFTVGDFYAVSNSGQFGSSGVLTFPEPASVPEAGSAVFYLAGALLLLGGASRRAVLFRRAR